MGDTQPSGLELAGIRFQIGIFEEALFKNPEDTEALRYLAHAYSLVGRNDDSLAADRRLVDLLPQDSRVRYNLACHCALAGLREDALGALEDAVHLGFCDVNLMRKDRDLDSLRDDPRYIAIEARIA